MLFASLYLDHIPLDWTQLPDALTIWLKNAGVIAAVSIVFYLIVRALSRTPSEWVVMTLSDSMQSLFSVLRYAMIVSGICYGVIIFLWLGYYMGIPRVIAYLPRPATNMPPTIGDWILTVAGLLALFVVLTPLALDFFTRISFGRIWALARLSWKEAIRGRVIWVFGSIALVFLFAEWFVVSKPEDQLRSYVRLVYWSITPLFLIAAALLGSFSIPTDVRNNTIHTIVTKPVEKFEIVLGRFLGYAALLTIGLVVISMMSLIYVVRGVNEEATRESYKARVPIYGRIYFVGTKDAQQGDHVGREWTYRSYITGPTTRQTQANRQYAVWDFPSLPAELGQRTEPIPFEFAFDIFRLSKGREGEGVFCTFNFCDGSRDWRDFEFAVKKMKEEKDQAIAAASTERDQKIKGKNEAERVDIDKTYVEKVKKIDADILAKYRIFQARREVTDYHTQDISMPPAVMQAILSQKQEEGAPAMRVFVGVDAAREAQMVGVAQQDFYLVAAERPFWVNFLKGFLGMWCTHMLVLGVAIAFSTYLTSVISFLATMFLFTAGMFVDYLREVADRRLDGGGPLEAAFRIGKALPLASKMEPSPTTTVVEGFDQFFSWWIGFILYGLPDVNRHDLHMYVANGFDVGFDVLFVDNLLPLFSYLAVWAVFAYYWMKFREIANPN